MHLWAGAAAAAGSAPSPAGGPAVVSSDSSFPISNSPFRYFASSSFSTSGLSRLFLMSILRFNLEGGGNGVPFFSCKKENLGNCVLTCLYRSASSVYKAFSSEIYFTSMSKLKLFRSPQSAASYLATQLFSFIFNLLGNLSGVPYSAYLQSICRNI